MVEVTRAFEVATEPAKVIDYLRDFSNAVEWDPGTVRCEPNDDGPVRVGSTWHNVSKFMGNETELTYELTKSDPDRVVFVGQNKTVTTTDDISVVAGESPGSSVIRYRANIELSGVAKVAAPAIKVAFEKLGNDTVQSITDVFGSMDSQ